VQLVLGELVAEQVHHRPRQRQLSLLPFLTSFPISILACARTSTRLVAR
jgi:hypothetical protein